jgi:hypothetical protein
MSYSAAELNELLARSLGTNPYGEGLFRWERSEDLFWPEFPTGRKTTKMVEVPIIGGGVDLAETVVPEYRSEPMCPKLDRQWVVTLWYPPESLDNWAGSVSGCCLSVARLSHRDKCKPSALSGWPHGAHHRGYRIPHCSGSRATLDGVSGAVS